MILAIILVNNQNIAIVVNFKRYYVINFERFSFEKLLYSFEIFNLRLHNLKNMLFAS